MYSNDAPGNFHGYRILNTASPSVWGERYVAAYEPHGRKMLLWKPPASLATDESAWRLMCAELGAWSRLEMEGALPLLDWGIYDSSPYFITSLPSGRELSEIIAEGVDEVSAAEIVASLSYVIEGARLRGILHLGINPGDIWLREDLSVEVAGFGLWYVAKDFSNIYHLDSVFVAPEQRKGGRVSSATDVYALAVIYLTLALGQIPSDPIEDLRSADDLQERIPPFVYRCIEERPIARCLTAGDFAEHLIARFPVGNEGSIRDEECPICRLQAQRRHLLGESRPHARHGQADLRGLQKERAVRLLIFFLLVATVIVWWLALR